MFKRAQSLLQKGLIRRSGLTSRIKMTADLTAMDLLMLVEKTFPMKEMIARGSYAQILFAISLFFSAWYCFVSLSQPILEWYGFRQTQTALTSYWLIRNGFSLDYWTPVVGQGWSIPFELPIYQQLVAIAVKWFSLPLTATGRVISWTFGAGSCIPIYFTLRRVGLDRNSRYFALALFLSSPLYVFWGATFMIESTALFFALCFVYYALKMLDGMPRNADYVLGGLFLTLCLLQKATTGLPLLMLFAVMVLVQSVQARGVEGNQPRLIKTAAMLFLALLIAYAWVRFGDQVKLANPIGAKLTAGALESWNYGTLEQRFSLKFWQDVVWERLFAHSMSGWIGAGTLGLGLVYARDSKIKIFIGMMLAAGMLPLLIFTNLHVVHFYYQTASLVFLLLALAAAATALGERFLGKFPFFHGVFMFFFVLSNFDHFSYGYLQQRERTITAENSRVLRLSEYVKSKTNADQVVIWYGLDWSSETAFYSERKSLTIPEWSGIEADAIENMPKYLQQPAALAVLCQDRSRRQKIETAIFRKYGAVRQEAIGDCGAFFLDRRPS
jgi:hypothetical protein